MWKPLLKCAIVGGLVVYIWHMFSWMILPWHDMVTNRFTNQQAVSQVLLDNAPENGLYVLPSMKPPMVSAEGDVNPQAITKPMSPDSDMWNGPFVYANVVREGIAPNSMTRPMILALIATFIEAFIITWLLVHTKAMRFWHRVRFVTIIGFLAAFMALFPMWNWWGFTGGFTFVGIIDTTIAWFLGGLVIARLVKN